LRFGRLDYISPISIYLISLFEPFQVSLLIIRAITEVAVRSRQALITLLIYASERNAIYVVIKSCFRASLSLRLGRLG